MVASADGAVGGGKGVGWARCGDERAMPCLLSTVVGAPALAPSCAAVIIALEVALASVGMKCKFH